MKWATLFRTNPVIILLQVSSLTLNNLHFILSELKKPARPAQAKEKIHILALQLVSLWVGPCIQICLCHENVSKLWYQRSKELGPKLWLIKHWTYLTVNWLHCSASLRLFFWDSFFVFNRQRDQFINHFDALSVPIIKFRPFFLVFFCMNTDCKILKLV